MALDRHGERPGEGVSQMIARKQYNRAIEVLRVRLQQRRPDPKTRLRLADLLVQAGRGQEAVPILLALADDFAGDGFVAKAVAVLKRVEKIRPNLADVNRRLDRLALQRDRAMAVPTSVLEPEGFTPAPLAPGPLRTPRPAPAPASEPESDEDGEPSAPNETVVRRMRGLLGRLLGGRQDGAGARPEATELGSPHVPVPTDAGPELDASAFLPRSFTQIPSAPAILPVPAEPPVLAAPEERREEAPALEAVAPPEGAPVVAPEPDSAPATQADEPSAAPEPPLEAAEPRVQEPPPPSEAVPEQPAPPPVVPTPEAEPAAASSAPEGGGFRGFLGRLWGRRRDEAPSVEPGVEPAPVPVREELAEPALPPVPEAPPAPTVAEPILEPVAEAQEPAPGATPAAAPEPSATREAAHEAVAPLTAAPQSGNESASPPDPATEALPLVEPDSAPAVDADAPASSEPPLSEADFHERLLDVVQEALVRPTPLEARPAAGGPAIDPRRLHTSPLLVELDDDELRQLVYDLRLRTCEPGDIVLTEGEPGETLFLLVGGTVKVFVRNPKSRNVEVRELGEGDFFGEVGFLSGRPRMATVVAATPLELLELERPALERLAQAHPGMQDMLEAYYLVRTQSDAAATLRSAAIDDPDLPRRAAEVLKAHFGEAHWDPRMRLKLAEALLKSGKQQEALPILAGLADELVRAGYTEKAVAILKRIERIEGRHTEQISLAPLKRAATPAPPAPPALPLAPTPAQAPPRAEGEGGFNGWLLELVRESVERGEERRGPGTAPGLLMSPLFEDFNEEELLTLVRGLRLLECGPGDVVITEGEDGNSVFVLTSGVVKVFVRNPLGHNVLVGKLGEGDFFGEISLLSGRPRSATITATGPCELLELDKPTLERVCAEHPRVRSVMEDIYIERASHPLAARVRGSSAQAEG